VPRRLLLWRVFASAQHNRSLSPCVDAVNAPPLMHSTTFGPARSFHSHDPLASFSETGSASCGTPGAATPMTRACLYVRGGSRKNQRPSSSYRCPTFAQPAFQQSKTIKEKRQWITIARSPDFAATRWYVLKLSVPDDCPSRSSTPTHRQTAERSCIG